MVERFSISQLLQSCSPAVLLAIWSFGGGTFWGGAGGWQALLAHLFLLIFVALAGGGGKDPLSLGRRGRWLPAVTLLWVLASALSSPVARAGKTGVALLLVFGWVPSAVAWCWRDPWSRKIGVGAVSCLVAVVSAVSLVEIARGHSERAAMPLGHHNLLAVWLLIVAPLTWVARGYGRIGRWLGGVSGLLALVALVATRSLAAALALVVVGAALARRSRWLVVLLAAAFLPQIPRLIDVVRGFDSSLSARLGYWQGGWEGWLARPWTGWGPGSSPWTLPLFLPPDPGGRPAGQVVADPHSLPLTLLFEIGAPGLFLALVLVGCFLHRRWLEQPGNSPPGQAALGGLVAGIIAGLAGAPFSVGALPLAWTLVAGAALAFRPPPVHGSRWRTLTVVVVLFSAVVVLPADLAHLAYDRARLASSPAAQQRDLERARRLDPGFPLYRARLAWLREDRALAVAEALAAAREAPGVSALWLAAGELALDDVVLDDVVAREAFLGACRTDPLGAVAPFRLATLGMRRATPPPSPAVGESTSWAARSFLGEPRLLAAPVWQRHPELLDAALGRLDGLRGVDPGWRQAMLDSAAGIRDRPGETGRLVLGMDQEPATSVSLYAFRRRPWPVDLAAIELDLEMVRWLELPPASSLSTTSPEVFEQESCGLPW